MSAGIQEKAIIGRAPTPEEDELLDWAEETFRKGLSVMNDGLKQLITLTTALLAGSAAIIDHLPVPALCKIAVTILLLLALAAALYGHLPRSVSLVMNCPKAIKQERERGLCDKTRCLFLSSLLLWVAFAFFVGGLAIQMLSTK